MISIVNSEFITSAVKPEHYPESSYLEIAVAGRSNVGKSSLINILLNRKRIAKTSSTPGKTRLVNFFLVRVIRYNDNKERIGDGFFSLVDLPGYGYARVSKNERESWKKMVSLYLEKRQQLRLVLLLVDIRHDADYKDKLMIDMLKHYNLSFLIVATKSDKVPKNGIPRKLNDLSKQLGADRKDLIALSALKKTGLEELLSKIEQSLF